MRFVIAHFSLSSSAKRDSYRAPRPVRRETPRRREAARRRETPRRRATNRRQVQRVRQTKRKQHRKRRESKRRHVARRRQVNRRQTRRSTRRQVNRRHNRPERRRNRRESRNSKREAKREARRAKRQAKREARKAKREARKAKRESRRRESKKVQDVTVTRYQGGLVTKRSASTCQLNGRSLEECTRSAALPQNCDSCGTSMCGACRAAYVKYCTQPQATSDVETCLQERADTLKAPGHDAAHTKAHCRKGLSSLCAEQVCKTERKPRTCQLNGRSLEECTRSAALPQNCDSCGTSMCGACRAAYVKYCTQPQATSDVETCLQERADTLKAPGHDAAHTKAHCRKGLSSLCAEQVCRDRAATYAAATTTTTTANAYAPATAAPKTDAPLTEAADADIPDVDTATTATPATYAPASVVVETDAPVTEAPVTEELETSAAPITAAAATYAPAAAADTTAAQQEEEETTAVDEGAVDESVQAELTNIYDVTQEDKEETKEAAEILAAY